MPDAKHTHGFLAALEIPPYRWWAKLRKTALGVGFIGGGVLMYREGFLPQWVHGLMLLVGGYCLAGDILRNFGGFVKALAKDVAEAIKDIKSALKNGG